MSPNTKTPGAFTPGVSNTPKSGSPPNKRSISLVGTNDKGKSVVRGAFSWEWRGVPFARVAPGIYDAVAVNLQGPEFVRRYGRWSLRIGFHLLSEAVEVSAYYNFGRDKSAPKILRSGKFYEAWCVANGDHPMIGENMDPAMFLEPGRIYTVEVEDAHTDADRQKKPEHQVYSRVKKIVSVAQS